MFCTKCHKIDIPTGYCSWVEIHPYKKKQYRVEFSMLHRHLIFSFVSWYNRQVLLLLMIVFMYRASKYGHHFLIAE